MVYQIWRDLRQAIEAKAPGLRLTPSLVVFLGKRYLPVFIDELVFRQAQVRSPVPGEFAIQAAKGNSNSR
jgi:hypothetical protein